MKSCLSKDFLLHLTFRDEAAPLIFDPTLEPVSLMAVPVRFKALDVFSPTFFRVSLSLQQHSTKR